MIIAKDPKKCNSPDSAPTTSSTSRTLRQIKRPYYLHEDQAAQQKLVVKFLQQLHDAPDLPECYSTFWTPNGGGSGDKKWSLFVARGDPLVCPQDWQEKNVYVGINVSAKRREYYQSSTNDTIGASKAVFAEFDGKDYVTKPEWLPFYVAPDLEALETEMRQEFEHQGLEERKIRIKINARLHGALQRAQTKAIDTAYMADAEEYNRRALQHIHSLPHQPTALWFSGGGYQAVWMFDKPEYIYRPDGTQDLQQYERLASIQKRWVAYVDGDRAASDLRRLLRLVGTYNRKPKYAPNSPLVSFISYDQSLIYPLDDLESLLPKTAPKRKRVRVHLPVGVASELGTYSDVPTLDLADLFVAAYNTATNLHDYLAAILYTDHSTDRMSRPGGDSGGVELMPDNTARIYSSADPLFTDGQIRITPAHALCVYGYNGDVPAMLSDLKAEFFNMTDNLPTIQSNHRQVREITANALDAIAVYERNYASEPLLYVRDATLVRVIASESLQDDKGRPLQDSRKIISAKANELSYVLERVADWKHFSQTQKKGRFYTPKPVPSVVINDLMGARAWPTIPPLIGLAYRPTFACDGSFHHKPGYDRASAIYHADAVQLGDTTPTVENLCAARSLLAELLCDFPFADSASRAHTLALILLPFVRDLITGPTPLHGIDAPTPGTGKGLLAEVCCYITRGHELSSTPAPKDEAEWSKTLATCISEGRTHVCFDNVNAPLDSASLNIALTQPRWNSRLLGVNRSVDLPIRQVWLATGNNLTFTDESARRVAWIRLEANVEKPDERTDFTHPDLRSWVRENRPKLVTACCTLICNWFAKGKPEFTKRTIGSYEAWSKIMGGILEVNGIEGFIANRDAVSVIATTNIETLRNFVTAWAEKLGTKKVSGCDLMNQLDSSLLTDVCDGDTAKSRLIQLGLYIKKNRGKVVHVVSGSTSKMYKIGQATPGNKGVSYQLTTVP